MNSEKTSKYSLLSDGEDDGHYPQPKAHKSRRSVLLYLILCVFLVASISLNISLLTKSDSSTKESALPESRWAHLTRNITTEIYASTKYGPAYSTQEELDKLWGDLDLSLGLIRLSDKFAEDNGLPLSQRFPWDQSQGVYYLGAFHQLHCLKEMYFWMSPGVSSNLTYEHVLHCMDSFLQNVMCDADDLPWYQLPPQPYRQKYARVQTRQCKSWQGLLDWAEEHNACFQNDVYDENGEPVKNEFEKYRFCPEGSPYTPVMESYFERHSKIAMD